MKTLKQILFAAAVTTCFAMTASAQKDDKDKPPPKEGKPPVICRSAETDTRKNRKSRKRLCFISKKTEFLTEIFKTKV